jgi:hypothetical protein
MRDIGFQPDLKILICVSCSFGLRCSQVHKHITGPAHKLRMSRNDITRAFDNRNLTVVADDEEVKPPPGQIAPIPWLEKERPGRRCIVCDYCSDSVGAMDKHWQRNHPGERNGRKYDNITRPVYMQRFFASGLNSTYFEVEPILRGSSTDDAFTRFYNSLPDRWRNGEFTTQVATLDGNPNEFDLPPFLAKTGWVNVLRGCSIPNLRAKVSAPNRAEKHYLHSIPGLGQAFLTSINDLRHVHPIILEGLTKWRSRLYVLFILNPDTRIPTVPHHNSRPFQLLTSEGSPDNYGRSADRLVLMVLRVMEESDPNFDEESEEDLFAELTTGMVDEDEDHDDSDSDTDSDLDFDTDSDSVSDGSGDDYDGDNDEDVEDVDEDALEELLQEAEKNGSIEDLEDEGGSADVKLVPEDERFLISLSPEQIRAAKVLARAAKANVPRPLLLEAYRRLVFTIFTTLPSDATCDPVRTPMEAFLMARGLNADQSFKPSHTMAPGFSHVQYLCLFSILDDVCRAPDRER